MQTKTPAKQHFMGEDCKQIKKVCIIKTDNTRPTKISNMTIIEQCL